jgi:aryl-alcohol dehydrogenase-like predicted oxidoreductase
MNAKGMRILAALDEVAARHRAALATVALAWLITRPSVTAPIASATSVPQLNELVAAVHLQLTADDIRLLDTASSPAEA